MCVVVYVLKNFPSRFFLFYLVTADTRFNKRRRLTSCGKSTPVSPPSAHKPEGLPDVVSKGFADIPDPPIRSPFILRRTTAPVSRTGVNTKTETSGTGVRTRSQLRQMPQRSGIPSFTASAATAVSKRSRQSLFIYLFHIFVQCLTTASRASWLYSCWLALTVHTTKGYSTKN